MIVEIQRAFKTYSFFVAEKAMRKQADFAWNFFQP